MAKKSAPGAAIIHIIGGIGEVSFPYALIKPITILGPICGSIAALFWFQIMGGGAVAAVSPGSIIALAIMSPKGKLFVNLAGYVIAAIVSFAIVRLLREYRSLRSKTSWMLLNRQQLPRRLKTWLNKSDCGAIIEELWRLLSKGAAKLC